MNTFAWVMVGILLLTITIFVHRHTYSWCTGERLTFPVWLLLLMVVAALIPEFNLGVFIIGALFYAASIYFLDIEFRYESKWWKYIKELMTKDIG